MIPAFMRQKKELHCYLDVKRKYMRGGQKKSKRLVRLCMKRGDSLTPASANTKGEGYRESKIKARSQRFSGGWGGPPTPPPTKNGGVVGLGVFLGVVYPPQNPPTTHPTHPPPPPPHPPPTAPQPPAPPPPPPHRPPRIWDAFRNA